MLIKRGKNWYAVTYCGDKQVWTNLHKQKKEDAQDAYRILQAGIKRERAAHTLTDQLMTIISQLASQEITKSEARGNINLLRMNVMREAWKVIDEWIPAPGLTAAELWKKYLDTAPDLKDSTRKTKEQRFNVFSKWAGNRDMRLLKESDCRRFLESLNTEKSQTINNYISDLSSIWKASHDIENPWGAHLRRKSNSERKKAFTVPQIRTIIEYCRENGLEFWRHAVTIGYYTGLRMKDVVYLSRASIRNGRLELVPEKTSGTERKVSIDILPPLQKELNSIIPVGNSLFFFPGEVARYEKDRQCLTPEFRKILDATGIYDRGYGFHSLRHTFITEALNAGIAVKDVQAVVGHEAVELTEGRYYHGNRNADLSSYPTLEAVQ